ncbi:MAG TPA: hypothetical protein VKD71_03590 [Gemmataceae bacterium]|nr:hypothetical protein [Gemmataceae bacterium]
MKTFSNNRFDSLTFEGFRELAAADGLSRFERIGFPDSYRDGYEAAIFGDIARKLTNLARNGQTVFDIGCGCSDLPLLLADTCARQGHTLVLCDSPEMLAHLPNEPFVQKAPGCFPRDTFGVLNEYRGRADAILVYSVLQYVFVDLPLFTFLDACLALLASGGQLLLGDIPNVSKRKRFFASDAGVRCHRDYTGMDDAPAVAFNVPEPAKIDDAVVLSIVSRAWAAGFDAYIVPQSPDLPMANRREDILIVRP